MHARQCGGPNREARDYTQPGLHLRARTQPKLTRCMHSNGRSLALTQPCHAARHSNHSPGTHTYAHTHATRTHASTQASKHRNSTAQHTATQARHTGIRARTEQARRHAATHMCMRTRVRTHTRTHTCTSMHAHTRMHTPHRTARARAPHAHRTAPCCAAPHRTQGTHKATHALMQCTRNAHGGTEGLPTHR